ncbi:FAD-binding oxidoreductase [Candidatus Woesearchaeota archaeon]|nr:FAD-binding oxidoreductase [Candidatus Woesearchaeota archaeon]MBW3021857.1 FAD-binding oxidoreductase [Candidatus Woesearchaeota archaeon]
MKKILEIFGNDASNTELDKLVYSYDASTIKGAADLIVWPSSILQIRKLISLANRSDFNIVVRGAGTGLVGGAVPNHSIVMDISKMNKILEFNNDEKTVIVEPGVILSELNIALKRFGLFFPVVPSSHTSCTIGGMIATNAVGNRALKYGRTSDWVRSLEVVDGTGKHIPIKDPEKICGTEGTIAVVVKAELKLAPLIKNTSMEILKFDQISELITKVEELKSFPSVLALEFVSKTASLICDEDDKHTLFVEFEGESGNITDPDEIQRIWSFRESFGQILASKGYCITEDPIIPFEKMNRFLDWLRKNKIPAFGHIGVGIIHPRFKHHSEHLIKNMFDLVLKLGGSVTGEHGIGLSKKEYVSVSKKQEIATLKQKYDPKNILNRGKII